MYARLESGSEEDSEDGKPTLGKRKKPVSTTSETPTKKVKNGDTDDSGEQEGQSLKYMYSVSGPAEKCFSACVPKFCSHVAMCCCAILHATCTCTCLCLKHMKPHNISLTHAQFRETKN